MSTVLVVVIAAVTIVALAIGIGTLIASKRTPDSVITRKSVPAAGGCPPDGYPDFTVPVGGKCFKPCNAGYSHSTKALYHYKCVRNCPATAPLDPTTGKCAPATYSRPLSDKYYSAAKCAAANGGQPCQHISGTIVYWKPCKDGYEPWLGLGGEEKHSLCMRPCPPDTTRDGEQCTPNVYAGPKGAGAENICPPENNPNFTQLIKNRCYEPCPSGYVPSGTKCKKLTS